MQITENTIHQSWIIQPGQKGGGLCISNVKFIENNNLIFKNIRAVVSVYGEKEVSLDPEIKHLRILIGDTPDDNIQCFFKSSFLFIEQNIKKTNVLVHCMAGVSRSATIVIAYLMRKYQKPFEAAITQVKQKRPYIDPNKGFIRQLKKYERQLAQQKPTKEQCVLI